MLEVLGEECCEGVEVLGGDQLGFVKAGRRAKPTVMRSVFDGGEGVTNGGRAERSRESGVWEPSDSEVDVGLADGEAGGDLSWADMDRVV